MFEPNIYEASQLVHFCEELERLQIGMQEYSDEGCALSLDICTTAYRLRMMVSQKAIMWRKDEAAMQRNGEAEQREMWNLPR